MSKRVAGRTLHLALLASGEAIYEHDDDCGEAANVTAHG
jgi:hypothetical protein